MNPNAPKPPSEQGPDVSAAIRRILDNKNDQIEGTFCHALFEDRFFDDALLSRLIDDMELVLGQDEVSPVHREVIHWVVLSTARCFFSHFNADDLYKIKNFDAALYSRWCDDHFERLRNLMMAR
ncbi:hypothetical protein [Variovorax boronicumulans]|uniref:hypothetical protein n=1 Tax=Variovorax boronicumulans TaxID=436515 RepID=UPI00339B48BC